MKDNTNTIEAMVLIESEELNMEPKKSVRFSRFQKVFTTHSPCDYDRTPSYPSLIKMNNDRRRSIADINNFFNKTSIEEAPKLVIT